MGKRWIGLILLGLLVAGCGMPVRAAPPLAVDTGIETDAWAHVPAGEFLMGLHSHETDVTADYAIMITDVTNQQYATYLNEALTNESIRIVEDEVVGYYPGDPFHGYEHEKEIRAGEWLHVPLADPSLRLTFDAGHFGVRPGYEQHPMVVVTWFGARAYCEFYRWRLPSEVEWEKAARGTDGRPYPWGHEIEGQNANFYNSGDPYEAQAGKMGDTTPVGFYNGRNYGGYRTLDSPSPYGLYDMAGNVWQWTGDVYEGVHYRYLRGGSKANYAYNLRVWTRNSAEPDYYSPSVGFRCARDVPE
jgi:formylglycine-generating enzyme required for sulfatase activity